MQQPDAIPGEWSLEVSDSERRTWRLQRIGWGLMVLLALAALLGFLGDGPVSARQARVATATIEWPRVVRQGTSFELTIRSNAATGPLMVALDTALLGGMTLQRWIPEPGNTVLGGTELTATFAREAGAAVMVRAILVPQRIGVRRGRVAVNHAPANLTFFTVP